MAQNLLNPNQNALEHSEEVRPTTLDDFIGQSNVCDNLSVFLQAAKARNRAIDHILLYGPPGLGKTSLARIVATEAGANFRSTSGPVITKPGDLAALLTQLEPGDVLFIDEIHRLSSAIEEILYPAMEDFELDILIGEGPTARSVKINISNFTLIGATTRAGLLSSPFRDRFGIHCQLQFYPVADLIKVIEHQSRILQLSVSPNGLEEIAKRSRGTPRIAGRLLRRIRDFAQVSGVSQVDSILVDEALNRLEVDVLGLDELDRRYMRLLAHRYGGGPVGLDTIAASINESKDVLDEVVEPYLLQAGMIDRTSRGRRLTKDAWLHLKIEPPVQEDTPLL